MQIKDVTIYNFGKLQNRTFQFAPGINVIYGQNEAGKTTLHTFLQAMLFGMEKGRGRSNLSNSYLRYEPWHSPAFYSGTMRFEVAKKPFYLERNFYHREKREILRNEEDGEELSVEYGDLSILLGGIGKETFGNTYDVPQCGVLKGEKLTEILAEYLANATEGGDGLTHVTKALGALENKRKELNLDLKKQKEEKQAKKKKLEIEKELLEQDCRKLRNEVAKEDAQWQQNLAQESKELEEPKEKVSGAIIVWAMLAIANLILYFWVKYTTVIFGVTEALLAAGLFGTIWRSRKHSKAKHFNENPQKEMESSLMQQAKRLLATLQEQLLEKETRLYNINEQLFEIEQIDAGELELLENIQALEIAEAQIKRLAKEYGEEMADEINAEVSKWVSLLTGGTYDSVQVDSQGFLKVQSEGRQISPEALSRGTLEQFYLAFRIAVGNIVTREEEMPLFLDETFCMYDDRRLQQTLQALADTKKQIFLFTCQKREVEILKQMGICCHVVSM